MPASHLYCNHCGNLISGPDFLSPTAGQLAVQARVRVVYGSVTLTWVGLFCNTACAKASDAGQPPPQSWWMVNAPSPAWPTQPNPGPQTPGPWAGQPPLQQQQGPQQPQPEPPEEEPYPAEEDFW